MTKPIRKEHEMKRTEDFVKQEIENKVALAVVESMTSEKVTTMVTDILNGSSGSSGWDRETFFEQILKTQLKKHYQGGGN